MNNHQALHFDRFLQVFDRLVAHFKPKVYFTCPCSVPCSVPCRSACTEQLKFYFMLLKTQTSLININISSTSHFLKITLHDLLICTISLGFYGGVKPDLWKGAEWDAIIVFSIIGFKLSINCTSLITHYATMPLKGFYEVPFRYIYTGCWAIRIAKIMLRLMGLNGHSCFCFLNEYWNVKCGGLNEWVCLYIIQIFRKKQHSCWCDVAKLYHMI